MVAQLVTCLVTYVCLTADPGVRMTRSHTFVEIESFKNGCCQLQAKVCAGSAG